MLRKQAQDLFVVIYKTFASNWFFWALLGLIIIEALWIALSSQYPMAFDEEYHLGLIKLYAAHPSPLWDGQPANANIYGSVATDPSYLYHWLMSFPYRVIALFTDNTTAQIILLRLLNIALFVAALPIWRKVMRLMGASQAMTNVILAIFVLIPIVPLLAGQINYDNLLFLLVAATSLQTIIVFTTLSSQRFFPILGVLWLFTLCIAAALVKYAFLPIFVVIVIALLVAIWRSYGAVHTAFKDLKLSFKDSYHKSRPILITALASMILLSLLFIQRDIENVFRYHTPAPSCDAVLSIDDCSEYGPWKRDYDLAQQKTNTPHNPIAFNYDWVRGMWHRSLFTLAGPTVHYQTRGPLSSPAYTSIALCILAIGAVLIRGKRIFVHGNFALRIMVVVATVYVIALWLDGFEAYMRTARAVAINGRYLLLVLLPVGVFLGLCISSLLGKRTALKTALALFAILGMAWGGGALTFIIRSNPSWYWSNQTVITANKTIRDVVSPLTPGSNRPTQFLP